MNAPAKEENSWFGFQLTKEGLLYKDNDNQRPVRICQAFDICDIAQNANKPEYLIKISFESVAQQKQTILIDLRWNSNKLRSMLDAAGFEIEPASITIYQIKKYIAQQLIQAEQSNITQLFEKTGWSNDSYILANRAFGSSKVAFKNNYFNPAAIKNCALNDWQKHVAQPAQQHTILHFALATAFAAALLTPLGEEGGGFHLVGVSSIGKSTAQYVAQSVFSEPSELLTWRTTSNALEYIAKAHNDQLLVLDELGQADEKTASKSAYLLANGSGKSRMGQETLTWKTLLLSSGENDFETISKAALHPGQLIRIVNIPIPHIIERKNGKAIAESLVNNAKQYNSVAIDAFVKHFQANKNSIQNRWPAYKTAFIDRALTALNSKSAQLGRLLNKFAVVAFAAQIASECGLIAPLSFEVLLEKLIKPATIFLSDTQSQSTLDIALNAVLQTIEKDESKFQNVYADKPLANRLGYFSTNNKGQKIYYFFAKSLKDLFTTINAKAAIQSLFNAGYLASTAANQKKIQGENYRVFAFDPNPLEQKKAEPEQSFLQPNETQMPEKRPSKKAIQDCQIILDDIDEKRMAVQKIIQQADNLHIKISLNKDGSLNIQPPSMDANFRTKVGKKISESYAKNYKTSILAYQKEIINHLKTLDDPAPF